MKEISGILRPFTPKLSATEQSAFVEYWQGYRSRRKAGDPSQLPPLELPYWMLLPEWLLRRSNDRKGAAHLTEIIEAQYLLFVAFRLYDDLLDEPERHPRILRSVPDALFKEAGRRFERLFPRPSIFWKRYPGLIEGTRDAIEEADLLQRTPASRPEHLLDEYARINSVFLTGSWAVCVLTGQYCEFEAVESFANKLSRGAQVLDDFFDVAEDLKRDRYNYVINVLIRSSNRMYPETPRKESPFPPRPLESILRLVENYYRTAYEQLRKLQIPESSRFALEYVARIESIRINLSSHQHGVVGA
jgi:hypothetical protein